MEVRTEALATGMFIDPPDGSVVSACSPLDEFCADVMRKLWIMLSQSNERGRQFLHHGAVMRVHQLQIVSQSEICTGWVGSPAPRTFLCGEKQQLESVIILM